MRCTILLIIWEGGTSCICIVLLQERIKLYVPEIDRETNPELSQVNLSLIMWAGIGLTYRFAQGKYKASE